MKGALLCVLLLVVLIVPPARASAVTYVIDSEAVATGTSNGYSNEAAEDGSSNVKTEAATSAPSYTTMMIANGDVSLDWDYAGPEALSCGAPAGTHFGCLIQIMDADAEPDGNTSYITGSVTVPDGQDIDTFATLSPALAAGTVVTNVRLFAWFRDNHTGGFLHDVVFWLQPYGVGAHAVCSESNYAWGFASGGGAFQNLTHDWATCDGEAWTVADINALTFGMGIDYWHGDDTASVTYAGAIVSYNVPTDYMVDVTSTFNGVEGSNLRVDYKCTTTDTEGLLVYVGGSAAGTTTCDGTSRTASVPGASGSVGVRLLSPTTVGDTTQSTYTFDLLVLVADVEDTDHGGTPHDPIACSYDWFSRSFSCVLNWRPPAGVDVVRMSWEIRRHNLTVATSEASVARLPTGSPAWDVMPDDYTVRIVVIHTYGWFERTKTVTDDDLPWAVVYAVVLLIVLAVLVALRGRVTVKQFKRKGRLPRVSNIFKARAISVEEYPPGWISYRQRDPAKFRSSFSRRKEGRWVVYGVTRHGAIEVQTVRVRKERPGP